ncbi:MAG: hypothetical protein WAU70_17675 [Flavobacteriales bacterium]
MARSFIQHYQAALLKYLNNDHTDNFYVRPYGAEKPKARTLRASLSHAADMAMGNLGVARMKRVAHLAGVGFNLKAGWVEGLTWLYKHLSDQASKDLLVDVIAYRALGHRHVKLPNNNSEHFERVERLERAQVGTPTTATGHQGLNIHRIDLADIGFPVKLFATPVGLEGLYQQQQYRYAAPNGAIEVEAGDVVIDAGGGLGRQRLVLRSSRRSNGPRDHVRIHAVQLGGL